MKRQLFRHSWAPYALLAPQIAIIAVFFVWPAGQALWSSFHLEDPFGFSSTYVGFENYTTTLGQSTYHAAFLFTLVFASLVSFLSMAFALLLAVKADSVIRGAGAYRVLLTWVYAVAPAVAGMLGVFFFSRQIGLLNELFNASGWRFNPELDSYDATFAVVVFAVWKQISINFVYFLAGLQSIPRSVREAAVIDCRSPRRRFFSVILPLLAPTAFFVLIINITYAFFETFAIIDVMTRGRPAGQTATLVYRVYQDGFLGADLGGSSAQSVIMLLLVLAITAIQFRLIERRIHY